MNAKQRRTSMRAVYRDSDPKFDAVVKCGAHYLMSHCVYCSGVLSLNQGEYMMGEQLRDQCEQTHIPQWLKLASDAMLNILVNPPEGTPEMLTRFAEAEREFRAEQELLVRGGTLEQ